ncbi:MAG: formimidoylglutamate deiminase [Woeseiaceae bacterium]
MSWLFARKALLSLGWANDVRLLLRAGRIAEVQTNVAPSATDEIVDILIPGLCNAHSHAFQRALAGRTERPSPDGKDNFWNWRTRMYELANGVDAGQMAAIAAQAYGEMLEAGYTSVAEFHYLHCDAGNNSDAMFHALQDAASVTGIRLTYVPVLYERAGFDHSELLDHQQRFAMPLDALLRHHERCSQSAGENTTVAIGAHSLRAVTSESLAAVAKVAVVQKIPMHLHIAEQQAEIEQCISATGKRPVQWLLDNVDLNERWCLVHATHMNETETERLAKSKAVICICPTTEANLGDGIFPLQSFLTHGGRIAIGSDSQVSINPFEELRWLEYGQRLATLSRNVSEDLFLRCLAGGSQAGGLCSTGLAEGSDADFVSLAADDPMLIGHDNDTILDALIYSGYRLPIERVMVAGEWRVADGRHVEQATTRRDFAAVMETLR